MSTSPNVQGGTFIWETRESGDINVCWNKTLNCYPNNMNGLYSENNLSNTMKF